MSFPHNLNIRIKRLRRFTNLSRLNYMNPFPNSKYICKPVKLLRALGAGFTGLQNQYYAILISLRADVEMFKVTPSNT
jgi:hypothetical protein